jgi:hypothetical protein
MKIKLLLSLYYIVSIGFVAVAKDRLISEWNCGQASDMHSIDVGDQANHSIAAEFAEDFLIRSRR